MSPSRLEQFELHLDRIGKRLTRERKLAAEIIFSLSGPFGSEQELAELVSEKAQPKKISRSTVFRVIRLLQEA